MNESKTDTVKVTSGGYSDIKEYLSKNRASGTSQIIYHQSSIKKKEDLNYGRS